MANLSEGHRGPRAPVPQLPITSRPISAVPPAPAVRVSLNEARRISDRMRDSVTGELDETDTE